MRTANVNDAYLEAIPAERIPDVVSLVFLVLLSYVNTTCHEQKV